MKMEIAVRILNAAIMIVLPLGLGVYLARRIKSEWRLFGIGVLVFVGSQALHIPFNVWVLNPAFERWGLADAQRGLQLAVVALLLGASAGIFEEIARYLAFRFWIKDRRDWNSALMLAAGHGGIESIFLGILALYALIQALALRGADLATILPPEQIETARAQLQVYWNVPWYDALMGAVERVGALGFHLGVTVMVLQAFRRRSFLWVGLAIGWHTLIDGVAVFAIKTWGIYITEGLVLLLGALSLGFVFWARQPAEGEDKTSPPPQPPEIESRSSSPPLDNLDDSRYI